jgi:hypothetical protein
MRRALVAGGGSIAFHGGLVAIAVLVATLKRAPLPGPPAVLADPVDVWSGVTAAIGGERLVDVNVDALGGQAGPSGAAAPAAPPSPPAAPPSPPRVTIPAMPAPKPAAEKPALLEDPAGIEPAPKPRAKKPKLVAADPAASSSAQDPGAPDEQPAAPPASPRTAKRKAGGGAASENGDGARTGPFGAEGPSAVRSLGRAFTRAIPMACQGDAGWGKLRIGEVGTIEVAITVDATGHISGYRSLANDPPKQLLELVKRTVALLDAGTFALKGSVGAGVEVLQIKAGVSDLEAASEGASVAALSFGEGKAAFTQESGRHVEVTLRVVKVEASTEP